MTDQSRWVSDLYDDVSWQRIPVVMSELQERQMISRCFERGLESMWIAIGMGAAFELDWLVYDENGLLVSTTQNLTIDQIRYAYLKAKVEFFKQVQTDVNNIVGYTTDALTVTNADKPYANLQQTIEALEKEIRQIFYTMIPHAYL